MQQAMVARTCTLSKVTCTTNTPMSGVMSEIFHDVISEDCFPEDGKFVAVVNGWQVLLCKVDGSYFAVNDRCSHAASPLSGGRIRRGVIMCPQHGARFELAGGRSLGGGYRPLRCFPVRVGDGRIAVSVPDAPPNSANN